MASGLMRVNNQLPHPRSFDKTRLRKLYKGMEKKTENDRICWVKGLALQKNLPPSHPTINGHPDNS